MKRNMQLLQRLRLRQRGEPMLRSDDGCDGGRGLPFGWRVPARVVALVRELRAPHVASVGVVSHKSCALRSSFSAYTPSPAHHHHRPTALAVHQLVEATRSWQSLVPSSNVLAQHFARELPSIPKALAPTVGENVISRMHTQCTLQHSHVACYQPMTTLVRVSQACHNVSKHRPRTP